MNNQTFYEENAYRSGYLRIAGVDEAGRGPLAGPVVAAACIFPRGFVLKGINDSKKVLPKKREEFYHFLTTHPEIYYGIGVVESEKIDQINILCASLQAMAEAIAALKVRPDYLLIDGNHLPPTRIPGKAVVKGDEQSLSIGAASILAKQYRDSLMIEYHKAYPNYRFDIHKGYGTKKHLEVLKQYGISPIHRVSFKPVRSLISGEQLDVNPMKTI